MTDSLNPSEPKPNLIGMTREQLADVMVDIGEKPFRAKQLWNWLYIRGVKTFADMTNLSKVMRERLEASYSLIRPEIVEHLVSTDGTQKWLFRLYDGNEIEAVFIPEDDRGALCVSSQVGCTLNCDFCNTGTQRMVRNLSAGEIVGQLLVARDSTDEWPSDKDRRKITNIVMMGMGEPLMNFENVRDALEIIKDGEGLSISRRRITVGFKKGGTYSYDMCLRKEVYVGIPHT